MSNDIRKKILFIGAGGELAGRIFPLLGQKYDIVGIAGRRQDLRKYCIDFYSVNLLTDYSEIFRIVFSNHTFDAIIWNPVRYFFSPLLETSRDSLHTEFDMAVALPVECVRAALQFSKHTQGFILISSMSAFKYSKNLASYGLVKNAQIKLIELFSIELSGKMFFKAIAPANIQKIPTEKLIAAFESAIENAEPERSTYEVI